jgi:hypothetical protein
MAEVWLCPLPQICSLLRGGIAERGGVRVGHRIIEINNQSVVAVPHEKIVNLLATSVGEVSVPSPGCGTDSRGGHRGVGAGVSDQLSLP